MNYMVRSILCLVVTLPAFTLRAQDTLPAATRQAIANDLAAAKFAPVKAAAGTATERQYVAAKRAWLSRVLLAPMKTRIAAKPWAAEAAAFADAALGAEYRQQFVQDASAALAGRARKLVAGGAGDPVILWLAVETINAASADDQREARTLAAKAREAFRNSPCSRVLGMLLYFQKSRLSRAAWAEEQDEAVLKAGEYLGESLKEPGTWTAADAPFYVSSLRTAFPSDLCRKRKDVLAPLFRPGRFPEWAEETLAGFWEVGLGWEGRGDDWAENVTEEGWVKFAEHLEAAETRLAKAWRLAPEQPYAAARMISVAMAGHAKEPVRVWFDRAVAARIDYLPAWRALSWAARPRWGGSTATMRAVALAAVECGRFDSDAPAFIITGLDALRQELDSYEDCRNLYRDPVISTALLAMCQGYTRALPDERTHWAWWRALTGWLSGRLDETRAALAGTGTRPMPWSIRWRLGAFMGDELTLRGEAAIDRAGQIKSWQEALAAQVKIDYPAAAAMLDKLTGLPPEALALVDRQRRIMDMEKRLAAGEWVKLPADAALTDWMWLDGRLTSVAGGSASVTGDGNRALMISRVRIGPSFEARGTIHATNPKSTSFCTGIAFVHRSTDGGPGRWMTAEIIRIGKEFRARLNKAYYRTGILEKAITADFGKPVPWSLQLQNDRLTWKVAGGMVCQNLQLADDERTGLHYRATPNGRVGFCSRITPEDNAVIYSPIEVRRIK